MVLEPWSQNGLRLLSAGFRSSSASGKKRRLFASVLDDRSSSIFGLVPAEPHRPELHSCVTADARKLREILAQHEPPPEGRFKKTLKSRTTSRCATVMVMLETRVVRTEGMLPRPRLPLSDRPLRVVRCSPRELAGAVGTDSYGALTGLIPGALRVRVSEPSVLEIVIVAVAWRFRRRLGSRG